MSFKDKKYVQDEYGPVLGSIVHPMIPAKEEACPVQAVNVAEISSPTPGLSPKQDPEVSRTLRDLDDLMIRLHLKMTSIEDKLNRIIEALAEDQDPDEMPATYMDGSPVR